MGYLGDFAEAVALIFAVVCASLFPREGGDPDWAPAFAGEKGAVVVDL